MYVVLLTNHPRAVDEQNSFANALKLELKRTFLLSFLVTDVKTKNQELRTELGVLKNNVYDTRTKSDDSDNTNTGNDKYPSNNNNGNKPTLYRSCLDLMNNGINKSGKYNVAPLSNFTKTVYCDQDTFGGGWTVFLRNKYSTVTFNKNWNEYKNGFGNVMYDLWLGNEFLYKVTTLYNSHSSKSVELYVSITDLDDKTYYSKYNNFAILSEDSKYTLLVSHHSEGNMGDSLELHNKKKFTTKDNDNDNHFRNCAVYNNGYPWWFDECYFYQSLLTFMYYDKQNSKYKAGPKWYRLHNNRNSLKSATMMFREKLQF